MWWVLFLSPSPFLDRLNNMFFCWFCFLLQKNALKKKLLMIQHKTWNLDCSIREIGLSPNHSAPAEEPGCFFTSRTIHFDAPSSTPLDSALHLRSWDTILLLNSKCLKWNNHLGNQHFLTRFLDHKLDFFVCSNFRCMRNISLLRIQVQRLWFPYLIFYYYFLMTLDVWGITSLTIMLL